MLMMRRGEEGFFVVNIMNNASNEVSVSLVNIMNTANDEEGINFCGQHNK
jgi:hypothetical protein